MNQSTPTPITKLPVRAAGPAMLNRFEHITEKFQHALSEASEARTYLPLPVAMTILRAAVMDALVRESIALQLDVNVRIDRHQEAEKHGEDRTREILVLSGVSGAVRQRRDAIQSVIDDIAHQFAAVKE